MTRVLKLLTGCGSLVCFGATCALWLACGGSGGGSLKAIARPGLAGSVLALLWKLLRDLEQKFLYVPYAHSER